MLQNILTETQQKAHLEKTKLKKTSLSDGTCSHMVKEVCLPTRIKKSASREKEFQFGLLFHDLLTTCWKKGFKLMMGNVIWYDTDYFCGYFFQYWYQYFDWLMFFYPIIHMTNTGQHISHDK